MNTNQAQQRIIQNGAKLQAATANKANKVISFGNHNDTKSFVDESTKALEFGLVIENKSAKDIKIGIAAGVFGYDATAKKQNLINFPYLLGQMDEDAASAASKYGVDCFLNDGTLFEDATGAVKVATKDSNRFVADITKFGIRAPFRFTKLTLNSFKTSDGAGESSNYNNKIKAVHPSPFEDTIPQEFSLRNIVHDKFQENLLELNFQTDAPNLQAIISNENMLIIQVNSGTKLDILASIGAQLSLPQWFYRTVKQADNVMRPILEGKGGCR